MSGAPWGPRLALVAVVTLVAVLGSRRIERDIRFYDEGVYVAIGQSLAAGSGYRNPILPGSPPQAKYPPAVPLLFGAVWRLLPQFPDNLAVMKAAVLVTGVGTLAVAWLCLRSVIALAATDALCVLAALGAGPFFLLFATFATSDIPYALVSVAALLFYQWSRAKGDRGWFFVALATATVAFLTRTAAIFVFGAFFVHLVLERRFRRAAGTALVCALVLLPWFVWSQWASAAYAEYPVGVRGNYVGYVSAFSSTSWLADTARIVSVNLRLLLGAWTTFVLPWLPPRVASLAILASAGALVWSHRRGPLDVVTVYCALYLVSIVIVPYPDTGRYALAIMPFLIAAFFGGIRAIVRRPAAGTLAIAALVLLALAVNVPHAWRAPREVNRPLLGEFHQTLDWIAANLPQDAILVGDYDPGYYLFTGRRAVRISVNDNLGIYYSDTVRSDFPEARELAESFQRVKACYFVRDPMIGGGEATFFRGLMDAVEAASPAPYALVYESPSRAFAVRRRTDCPPADGARQTRTRAG